MKVRFAVLGAGRIGQVHADAIATVADATLVAIADPVGAAAQLVQDKYGCDIRTIDEIAHSDDIDAAIICTPTDTHADLIEQFARLGKAVFCEKPIDLDLTRVRECLTIVESAKATLMVGFNRRFDPDFQALKRAIDGGQIGNVEMVTITSRDPGPPPADYITRSGGIFRDMTIHDFDIARWLLDEEIATVQAAASNLVDPEIGKLGDYDSANIILTTASGRQATITNSRRARYGYDQRIEVHGSVGSVAVDNHHLSRVTVATENGFTRPALQDFFMSRYADAYAAEISAFVQSVCEKTQTPTTGHDGFMALALAEAALLSVKERRVVNLKEVLETVS
ncbi:MAG: inositol 2-dehydrogenase [Paracoccaceae bacterium]